MISILILIKNSLKDLDAFKQTTVEAIFPDDSMKPLSFLDYTKVIGSEKKCVLRDPRSPDFERRPFDVSGMEAYFHQVPFVKCDSRKCEKEGDDASNFCAVNLLALAPIEAGDDERMLKFKDYISTTYSQISNYTKFDVVQDFKDRAAIDEYVQHEQYGVINKDGTVMRPKIALAVLIGGSEKEYEYAIRTNSTGWNNGWDAGRPVMTTQPKTDIQFNTFAKLANTSCTLEGGTALIGIEPDSCVRQYMYNGALTIQRLVDDFIHYDSGAADRGYSIAESGVSFAYFPSKEFVRDGFYAVVAEFVPLLLVLGLLYPFAAMLRSIVQEKEMRQKELMKMMSISEVRTSFIILNIDMFKCSFVNFFSKLTSFTSENHTLIYLPLSLPLLIF